jgi:hypothetical protein
MSRRLKDTDGQAALQPQFEKPLDLVPELMVDSSSSASALLQSLESQMTNCARDDWQPKVQAIQTAMSYLKGGISQFPDADFSVLAGPIEQCVSDLRSALVRWGALYTAAGSQVLQSAFLSSAEVIVPSLFRQLSHGTGLISNSCHLALLEVARYVQHRRTARFFLQNQSSRSSNHRQVVVEFLRIATECWAPSVVAPLSQQFQAALRVFHDDPAAPVRKFARELLNAPATPCIQSRCDTKVVLTPKYKPSHIPVPPTPHRTPTVRKMKSVKPDDEPLTQPILIQRQTLLDDEETAKDIDDYMPPRSLEDTARFLRLLIEITSKEEFKRLDGIDVLIPASIVAAPQFLPDIKHWQSAFLVLFQQFPALFEDQILQLFQAFRFDPWLVRFAVKTFGIDELSRKAVTFSDDEAFRFFTSALSKQKAGTELSPKVVTFLTSLAAKFGSDPSVDTIRTCLDISPDDDPLESEDPDVCRSWLEKLTSQIVSDPTVLPKFIPRLRDGLGVGSREHKVVLLEFCTATVHATRSACFGELVPVFQDLLGDEDRRVAAVTKECLFAMLEVDRDFVVRILERIHGMLIGDQGRAFALLSVLPEFFGRMADQEMALFVQPVMTNLKPAFASDVVGIRRMVVMILVEFKVKIPQEFDQYVLRLHPAHQKLIDLYKSRRAPK